MKYRFIYLIISLVVIIPGIVSLVRFGLKPAIDFTGGTVWEMQFALPDEQLSQKIAGLLTELEITVTATTVTEAHTLLVRTSMIDPQNKKRAQQVINEKIGAFEEKRFETVGPTLGAELMQKTFIGAAIAIIGILLYIAYAFKNIRYGVCAIVALFHDVLVVVGSFSLIGHFLGVQVDALFVTAVLTTMSFSVHDTIVVFDRIREYQKREPHLAFEMIVNRALTETMSRSVNNSLTIIFMLLALFLLGGPTIKWFVFALLIGTVSGTYSSPFVATPVLFLWTSHKNKN